MAIPGRGDSDFFAFAILLFSLSEDDDPMYVDMLWRRMRSRLRNSEMWDPEIDELIKRRLFSRRGPRRVEQMREVATSVLEGYRRSFEETVTRRVDEAFNRIAIAEKHDEAFRHDLSAQGTQLRTITQEIQSQLWLASVGVDYSEIETQRFVPIRIYISDPVPAPELLNRIVSAVRQFTSSYGFELADEFPEESGSWWKRLVVKLNGLFTHKEVRNRLDKAEQALDIHYLDKPQADANRQQAEAAASLITSLKETPQACIQVGSLLLVKSNDENGCPTVVSRTLSPSELKRIEENQSALRSPSEILNWLQKSNCRRIQDGEQSGEPEPPNTPDLKS